MTRTNDAQPERLAFSCFDPELQQLVFEEIESYANAPDDERQERDNDLALFIESQVEEESIRAIGGLLIVEYVRSLAEEARDSSDLAKLETKFNLNPIVEISQDELPTATERLLAGKNIAAVLRAARYTGSPLDLMDGLGLEHTGTTQFPGRKRGTILNGCSEIHLDNFVIDEGFSDFKLSMTMSETLEGRVVFVGGLATKRVRGFNELTYDLARSAILETRNVKNLKARVRAGNVGQASTQEFFLGGNSENAQRLGVAGEMVAVELGPGDLVIWPQGGQGSRRPVWHGFYQVGDILAENPTAVPRKSLSHDFVLAD